MKLPDWKWKRIAIYAGAATVGVLIMAALARNNPETEYDTQVVERGTLRQTVQVTGEVVSSADIDLRFESSGRIRTVSAKVGDVVKQGDLLATIDDRNEGIRVMSARASLQSAQANLQRVLSGATNEDVNVLEVAVTNAEVSLTQSSQTLEDARSSGAASLRKAYGDLDGQMETLFQKASSSMQALKIDVYDGSGQLRYDVSSPDFSLQSRALLTYSSAQTSIIAMESAISAYRTSTTDAERDSRSAVILENAKKVRDAAQSANALMQVSVPIGGTTAAAFATRQASVRSVWIDMNTSINSAESQKLLVASTITTNTASINAADKAVRAAEGALESAKANLAFKKAPATQYDVASARASVSQASASLSEASLAYEKTRIRAPFAGTIASVTGRVGSTVTAADVILKLHGEDVYEVEASVPETDVAKLRTGMKSTMTLDAYGDDVVFEGEVSSIDAAQTVLQDVVYYKTRFVFAAGATPVKAGMTASVDVTTVERAEVLSVPQRAIRDDAATGNKYVRLLENGIETKREVETGVRGDGGLIEIVSGLTGGENIILAVRVDGKILKEE